MTKYLWLLALAGGMGCSGGADVGAAREAVKDEQGGKPGLVKDGTTADASQDGTVPDKGSVKPEDPGNLPPTTAGTEDGCSVGLAAAAAYIDEALKSGDPEQVSAAKQKYELTAQSCTPSGTTGDDGCTAVVAVAQAYMDDALKIGDASLITAAKEKLGATIDSCSAPGTTGAEKPEGKFEGK